MLAEQKVADSNSAEGTSYNAGGFINEPAVFIVKPVFEPEMLHHKEIALLADAVFDLWVFQFFGGVIHLVISLVFVAAGFIN